MTTSAATAGTSATSLAQSVTVRDDSDNWFKEAIQDLRYVDQTFHRIAKRKKPARLA